MTSFLKPIQVGGACHTWRSPDGINHNIFLKLDISCEVDPCRGILIITDERCQNSVAYPVNNLKKELSDLLSGFDGVPVVYWSIGLDEKEIAATLIRLTRNPTFYG
jgi:hypothetical protein